MSGKFLENNKWIKMLLDAAAAALALWAAFGLRFDWRIPEQYLSKLVLMAVLIVLLRILLFWSYGVYKGVWRYASLADLLQILKAISLGSVIILLFTWVAVPSLGYPRSVIIIEWLADLMLIGGLRMTFRLWTGRQKKYAAKDAPLNRVLIVGAGDAGEMVARQMLAHPEYGYQPVGFVDDDPRKRGKKIHGISVYGGREDIHRLVREKGAGTIVIAIPSAPGPVVKMVVEQCQKAKLKFKIVPGIREFIEGEVSISQLRDIELDDLLRRPVVTVNLEEMAGYLTNKTVLVSGAGGSIGSELCRQIAAFRPGKLLLLGKGENSLYHIAGELSQRFKGLELLTLICDVADAARVDQIFGSYRPEVVFHAAAHKHVPMMEQNPGEAIKNNIFGTKTLAEAALKHGTGRFVLVSTDKAVNPTSVMGATKRISEKVIMNLNGPRATKFMAVRFGNVLGSSGSVVPLFKKQIAAGGPITVTHPEMERYFMTIPEAAQLVIQAGAMGKGGEVFVLDMGKPVKIVDLARDMIRLSGLTPDTDIRIEFTGLRKGEKLHEELMTAEEGIDTTRNAQIFMVKGKHARLKELPKLLPMLYRAAATGREDRVVAAIQKVIPGFRKEA